MSFWKWPRDYWEIWLRNMWWEWLGDNWEMMTERSVGDDWEIIGRWLRHWEMTERSLGDDWNIISGWWPRDHWEMTERLSVIDWEMTERRWSSSTWWQFFSTLCGNWWIGWTHPPLELPSICCTVPSSQGRDQWWVIVVMTSDEW